MKLCHRVVGEKVSEKKFANELRQEEKIGEQNRDFVQAHSFAQRFGKKGIAIPSADR